MAAPIQISLSHRKHLFAPVAVYKVQLRSACCHQNLSGSSWWQGSAHTVTALSAPPYKFLSPSHWPSLGHMSVSGPITRVREMECAHWVRVGHMFHLTFKQHSIKIMEWQYPHPNTSTVSRREREREVFVKSVNIWNACYVPSTQS